MSSPETPEPKPHQTPSASDATTLKTTYILSIFTPIFGVVSLYSFILRTVRLAKKSSTCRPLGSTGAWTLDYFDWNFAFGLVVVSVIIAIGISRNPSSVKITSLPLSVLILLVCGQMVLLLPLRALGVRAPFRFSSIARGDALRPAVYVIGEDVVAVDGEQGDVFRAQWNARYESSAPFRTLLARLDWFWGVSGVSVAGTVIGVIFGFNQDAVGWAVGKSSALERRCFEGSWTNWLITGWSVPWIWAALMMIVTIEMTKSTCRQENEMTRQVGP